MIRAGTSHGQQIQVAAVHPTQPHGALTQLHGIAAPFAMATQRPVMPGTPVRTLVRRYPEVYPLRVVLGGTYTRTTTVDTVCEPGWIYETAVTANGVHYMPTISPGHYATNATSKERKEFALRKANGNADAAACLETWHTHVEKTTGMPIGTLHYPTVSVQIDIARAVRLTNGGEHVTVDLFRGGGGEPKTARAESDSVPHVLTAIAGLMNMSTEEFNKRYSLPQARVLYPVNGEPKAKRKRGDEQPGLLRDQPTADLTLTRNPPCCRCNEPTRPARAFKPHPKDKTKLVMCRACAADPTGILVGHLHYRPTKPQRLTASLHVAPRQPLLNETVGITIGLCCQRLRDAPEPVDTSTLHPLAALIVESEAYFKYVAPMIGFSPDDMLAIRASAKTRIVWCNEHLTGDARKGFLKLCAQFKLRMVRYLPPCACAPLGFECPSVCWQVPLHGFVHELDKLIPNRPATPFGTPPTRESLMQRIAWCEDNLTGSAKTRFRSACEAYKTQTVKLTPVFFSCGRDLPRPPAFCAGVRGRSRVRAR